METAGRALIDSVEILTKVGLTEGMRVADMGCGRTGHFVLPSAKAVGKTGLVYAVDIMKEILEGIDSWKKSLGLDNIQPIWSDIEVEGKTPIPAKSLDVCFFMNVFFMLKHRLDAFKEATRLLKDDGQVVVVDWNKNIGTLGPTPEKMVKADDLVITAQSCGLRLVDNFPAGNYHYCLIFKKN